MGVLDMSFSEPKKVCRTLFNRTMSLTTDIGCKRHRVEEDSSTTSKRNRGAKVHIHVHVCVHLCLSYIHVLVVVVYIDCSFTQ